MAGASRFDTNGRLLYTMNTGIRNPEEIEDAMGEATGLMRTIRQGPPAAA